MSGILPLLRWTLRNCLLITSSLSAGQGGSVSCTCVLLTYLRYSQRYVNGELHTNGYQGSIANWASWRDTRYVPSSRSLICCLCQYFEWLHHMAWSGCQKAIGKTIFEKKGIVCCVPGTISSLWAVLPKHTFHSTLKSTRTILLMMMNLPLQTWPSWAKQQYQLRYIWSDRLADHFHGDDSTIRQSG